MSGNKLFVDTNIILYLLSGDDTLAALLDEKQVYISFVTQLELLSYHELTSKDRKIIEEFIANCVVIDINNSIKKETILLRKNHKIKLPDSIIAATAKYLDILLITSDKGMAKLEKEIDVLIYER